ncbi:MAG: phenylacetic acid degradation operon negative regulatory protein PaaX [Pseudomonadota bacterium]
MKQMTSTEWIAQFLASEPPRSKSLVMTIFGDAIAPHGGKVWLGSLIELLAPFGVNDRLLRTSVFRLVQEGWLVAHRDGRRSLYAIRPDALARFERANRRIYAQPDTQWDGSWTLLIGSNRMDAPERAALRKELEWEGYALIVPGVLAHPAANSALLEEIIARTGVAGKLFAVVARGLDGVSARPLAELVHDCWDLSAISAAYQHFIDTFAPLEALLQQENLLPQAAFVIRSLLIHAYRRVELHDPMLPLELLPDPWPGTRAYALARDLYRLVQAQAEFHIVDVMRRGDAHAPLSDAAFTRRFGGLA